MTHIVIFLAPLVVAIPLAWLVIRGLRTGAILPFSIAYSWSAHKTVSKRQEPVQYWTAIILLSLVAILLTSLSLGAIFGISITELGADVVLFFN